MSLTDSQLIITIRQIEASSFAGKPHAIREMVRENLRNLRAEADRRGLRV